MAWERLLKTKDFCDAEEKNKEKKTSRKKEDRKLVQRQMARRKGPEFVSLEKTLVKLI